MLPRERNAARVRTIANFRVDLMYIRYKEDNGQQPSSEHSKVKFSEQFISKQLAAAGNARAIFSVLSIKRTTGGQRRVGFLRRNRERGWAQDLYVKATHNRESRLHILYKLTWFAPLRRQPRSEDGRGPADFKISRGEG